MTSYRNRKIVSIMTGNIVSRWTAVLVFFVLLAILPGNVSAFNIPEKLIFDLTWTGLKAGTATLEIVNEKGYAKIISTARSAEWLSAFYMVDDRTESVLKNTPTVSFIGLPENYRIKLREGRHRRD